MGVVTEQKPQSPVIHDIIIHNTKFESYFLNLLTFTGSRIKSKIIVFYTLTFFVGKAKGSAFVRGPL